jgi:hypothetical protein
MLWIDAAEVTVTAGMGSLMIGGRRRTIRDLADNPMH